MRTGTVILIMIAALLVYGVTKGISPGETATVHLIVPAAGDTSLSAVISLGSGDVVLRAGSPDTLVSALVAYDKNQEAWSVSHRINDKLDVSTRRVRHVSFDFQLGRSSEAPASFVALSPAVAYSLDLDLSVGDAFIDLTGFALSGLHVEAGVGDASIRCGAPQPRVAGRAAFDLGVGDVTFYGLGNLRAETIVADLGTGDVKFDLSGRAAGRTNMSVDIGVGDVQFYVPDGVGVRITLDDADADVLLDGPFTQEGNVITSAGYETDSLLYDIEVTTGVGDVTVFSHSLAPDTMPTPPAIAPDTTVIIESTEPT